MQSGHELGRRSRDQKPSGRRRCQSSVCLFIFTDDGAIGVDQVDVIGVVAGQSVGQAARWPQRQADRQLRLALLSETHLFKSAG